MPSTLHSEFNGQTEGLDVAKVFLEAIRGKTILVAGANREVIGFATFEALVMGMSSSLRTHMMKFQVSQSPARIILAGRSASRFQNCIDALKENFSDVDYRCVRVDLSSQRSVRNAATEVPTWPDVPYLDTLINNAGVILIPERHQPHRTLYLHVSYYAQAS